MNKLAELRRPDLEAALTTKRSFDTANGFNVGLKRSRPKPDVNVGVNAVSKVTTKQKILDSAFQVLLEKGFVGFTMQSVAAAALPASSSGASCTVLLVSSIQGPKKEHGQAYAERSS